MDNVAGINAAIYALFLLSALRHKLNQRQQLQGHRSQYDIQDPSIATSSILHLEKEAAE